MDNNKKNNLEKKEKKVKKEIKKEIKKTTKKEPKKEVKKVIKKEPVKEIKEVKEVKEPVKKVELPKEEKKESVQVKTDPYLVDIKKEKEKRNNKLKTKCELFVVFVFSIIMLVLLCNRTFFRTNYKNSKININIPLLMFFKSDDGNHLELKTLRKTQYLTEYFENKLKSLKKYSCNNYTFYYDEENFVAIYDIKIDKNFIVKTVTIDYAAGDANCLCNANATGKEAERICKK